MCHLTGATGSVLAVSSSDLASHRLHGDYLVRLIVDGTSAPSSDSIHFSRIGDAIAAARAGRLARKETASAACRITIDVAAGVHRASMQPSADASVERLPLVIDVPDLTLRGTLDMPVDAKGRALGSSSAPTPTTLVASPGLVSISTGNLADKFAEPLILVNGHPDGPAGNGAIIEGFILQSGNPAGAVVGGNAVWAMRVNNIVVRGNQIEGGFAEPVEMRASIGRVERNLLKGPGQSCALCMFGPGDYTIIGNRQVGLAGRLAVLVFPTMFAAVPPGVEPYVLPATALVTASVTNNDFRDHQEAPFGIGLRVAAVGPGAPDVVGTARVVATDNDLSSNRWGVVVEGGILVANTTLRGTIDLTLRGNTLTGSCQNAMLVTTAGQSTAVGLASGASLRNSTISIALGGDIPWSSVWYSHAAGLGNVLNVDGLTMSNGSNVTYDRNKVCPVA